MTPEEHLKRLKEFADIQEKLLSQWYRFDDRFVRKCLRNLHWVINPANSHKIDYLINEEYAE